MKTRVRTIYGMCNVEPCGDPKFKKVTFDRPTHVKSQGITCSVWMLSKERLAEIVRAVK